MIVAVNAIYAGIVSKRQKMIFGWSFLKNGTVGRSGLNQDFIFHVNYSLVNDIWNKSCMNCGNEMKMKKWSSQWTQFMQLRKEAWKKKNQDFNRVWIRDLAIPVRCSTNWAMKPAPNVSGFISAVHIWFISYIINKWVIHMKIKSWLRPLRPTVPFFKKDHPKIIFCLLLTIPGWLSLHSIQQPSCPPVYNWLGWSGQVQEGHFSCWWHPCGVLQNSPPTRVQSPQCTLSMDIWCMTNNKPHCPWCRKNVPWC